MIDPKFLLRFTNQYGETYYFVALGERHLTQWLISATTPDRNKARKFDTAPEAAQVLVDAGNPVSWEILPV